MKKLLLAVIILCFTTTSAYAIDLTLKIPAGKEAKIKEAFKNLYTIPTTEDADGVVTPTYSDAAWVRRCVRQFIINTSARWEQLKAKRAVKFLPDDQLVD